MRRRRNLCNSYTLGCLPVRGDNPRALASGLSYVQVDKHSITILYYLHQCRPCTSRDVCAKDGKGGIKKSIYAETTRLSNNCRGEHSIGCST